MKPVLDTKPIRLPAHAVHCIEGGKGLQVTAVGGTVWLTQAGDSRDLTLRRGQSFILDRHGRAVVYALEDAAVVVGPAGHVTAADFAAAMARDQAAEARRPGPALFHALPPAPGAPASRCRDTQPIG